MARKKTSDENHDSPRLFDEIDFGLDIDFLSDEIAGPIVEQHTSYVAKGAESQSFEINPEVLSKRSALKFRSFGSGSSGNCAYLGNGESGILIDAGVDPEKVYKGLKDNKIDLKKISGIVLTHDHADHVKYAYTILRTHRWMVLYATPRTMSGLLRRHSISRRIKDYHKAIYKEFPFKTGSFEITPFETSHDGTDNVGYFIESEDKNHRFVVATDMGKITDRADFYMRQANYLMIESNYDMKMLMQGAYPEYLKARIVGERGHMDNIVTADYVSRIYSPELSHVFLCHLSEDNNSPTIALSTVRSALETKGLRVGEPSSPLMADSLDVGLTALPRFESSPLYLLRRK